MLCLTKFPGANIKIRYPIINAIRPGISQFCNLSCFFNKIIIKFVSNNNLNIKNSKNTAEIFEKIYKKNKIFLLKNISKIITNNSICFTESIIYMNGIGDVYHGVEKVEILEYNKNFSE